MIIKYAVLNPFNGEYTKVNTKDEAYSVIVKTLIEFYKIHVHNNPIAEIQVNENGDEIWSTDNNGTELPDEYIQQIKTGVLE
jgi:hypothetical protein